MPNIAIAPDPVSWKPQRRRAAGYLAIGTTAEYASEQSGVPLRTVKFWQNEPGFDAYVRELRATAWQRVEPAIMSNVELALEVQRTMLQGKIPAKDDRYREAARLIDRFLDRLLYVEPASPGGQSGPRVAVSVSTNSPAVSYRVLPGGVDRPDDTADPAPG